MKTRQESTPNAINKKDESTVLIGRFVQLVN